MSSISLSVVIIFRSMFCVIFMYCVNLRYHSLASWMPLFSKVIFWCVFSFFVAPRSENLRSTNFCYFPFCSIWLRHVLYLRNDKVKENQLVTIYSYLVLISTDFHKNVCYNNNIHIQAILNSNADRYLTVQGQLWPLWSELNCDVIHDNVTFSTFLIFHFCTQSV